MSAAFPDPGRLRHRVTLAMPSGAPDGAGGASIAWTTVATVFALVAPARAAERAVAGHMATAVTHRITLRWRADLTGGRRAPPRGRPFRVLAAVDPDGSKRFLVLEAVEEAQ